MSSFQKFYIILAGAIGIISLAAHDLAAQSAFATRGLGVEIEPLDARARGLGGAAVGFLDPEISWANTAASSGLAVPGIIFGYQYDNFDSQTGTSAPTNSRTARFPLILGAFPVSERLTLTAGFGSFLDQSWSLEREDTMLFAGDSTLVRDEVSSRGGVSRLRAGVAYGILTNLSIGLSLDSYTGNVQLTQGRRFALEPSVSCCRSAYNYSGFGYGASFKWDPSEALSVAGSASYGGTLDAEVQVDTTETLLAPQTDRSYELPLQLRGGVSGRVGQATVVTAGGSWNQWSKLNDVLGDQGGARDSWSAQAGVEYEGLVIRERPVPIRFGGRTGALPFSWSNSAAAAFSTERALSVGAGLVLAGGATRSDIAFEFGGRGDDESAFSEDFWRFAFSIRVLGR